MKFVTVIKTNPLLEEEGGRINVITYAIRKDDVVEKANGKLENTHKSMWEMVGYACLNLKKDNKLKNYKRLFVVVNNKVYDNKEFINPHGYVERKEIKDKEATWRQIMASDPEFKQEEPVQVQKPAKTTKQSANKAVHIIYSDRATAPMRRLMR